MEQFDKYVEALRYLRDNINNHAEKYGIQEVYEGWSCVKLPLEWSPEHVNSIRNICNTSMTVIGKEKVISLLQLKTISLHKWVGRMSESNFDLVVRVYAYSLEEVGYFVNNIMKMESELNG